MAEKVEKVKEEQESKPVVPTLESLSKRVDEMVTVINNLITYCNTIEKWRTVAFQQEKPSVNGTQEHTHTNEAAVPATSE